MPVMIREERYLEAETYSAEEESDRDRLGACLMAFGRRVTDLAEEYVPKVKRPISSSASKIKQQLWSKEVKLVPGPRAFYTSIQPRAGVERRRSAT